MDKKKVSLCIDYISIHYPSHKYQAIVSQIEGIFVFVGQSSAISVGIDSGKVEFLGIALK